MTALERAWLARVELSWCGRPLNHGVPREADVAAKVALEIELLQRA